MDKFMPAEPILAATARIATERIGNPGAVPPMSRWYFVAALQATEAALAALFCLVLLDHLGAGLAPGWQGVVLSGLVCIALAAAIVSVHRSFGAYAFGLLLRPLPSVAISLAAWSVVAVPAWVLGIAGRLSPAGAPAGSIWWLAGGIGAAAIALRLTFALGGSQLRRLRLLGDSAVIVGTAAEAEACAAMLARQSPDVTITGYFSVEGVAESRTRPAALPLLGQLPEIAQALQQGRVDQVVAALPVGNAERLPLLERYLLCLPTHVSLGLMSGGGREAGGPSLVPLRSRRLDGWGWVYKDVQDRVLACLGILAVSPAMLAIAIAIRLSSPGKIFFRQIRRGYGGEDFEILKFRTMHAGVSDAPPEALRLTERDDPRIFWFGKFLRKTSLDELPQLFNVLLGDMWLVGPRPHPPFARAAGRLYADVVENYAARHWVKPGITGWAQVNGWRGPTETAEQIEQRVTHDLHYIDNWSPGLDLRILLRTAAGGFMHENAF